MSSLTSPFEYLWEPGGSTTQAIAGLTAGTYTVTVTDKNGCEAVVEVVVDLMLSSTKEAAGQVLLMYPNPAVDWVKVVVPDGRNNYLLELSDASGRVLRSQGCDTGDCVLDLRGLASGAYVLMVKIKGQLVFASQVVKQ